MRPGIVRALVPALLASASLTACHRAAEGAKEALNKGGELAGSAATEVIEGVTTGVEQTWKVDVRLSAELSSQGLGLGKTSAESDSAGNDNHLIVYLTNERAVRDTLHVIAMDKDSLEMGRATLIVDAPAGSGAYYEVRFPARTDLERKSTVWIQ